MSFTRCGDRVYPGSPRYWAPVSLRHPVDHGVYRLILEDPSREHIVDCPLPEGRDRCMTWPTATKAEVVYAHKWAAGDGVMWDTRLTMYRLSRHDPEGAPRELRRTWSKASR